MDFPKYATHAFGGSQIDQCGPVNVPSFSAQCSHCAMNLVNPSSHMSATLELLQTSHALAILLLKHALEPWVGLRNGDQVHYSLHFSMQLLCIRCAFPCNYSGVQYNFHHVL